VLYLQITIYVAYSDLNLHFNYEVYHTVETIRVNHALGYGSIISVLLSFNSVISVYKKY